MANQPVPDQAGNYQIGNADYINGWLTYMVFHIIEEVLSTLVLDIVHERAFLRCQGTAVFWICETRINFVCQPKGQSCA